MKVMQKMRLNLGMKSQRVCGERTKARKGDVLKLSLWNSAGATTRKNYIH